MLRRSTILVLVVGSLFVPALALATGGISGYGAHGGFSSGPSQVVLGGQFSIADAAPRLDFVPGLDLGFGDNQTIVSVNGDFHYRFDIGRVTWQPYAGAGVAIHFVSIDVAGPYEDRTQTLGGGDFILGVQAPSAHGGEFFGEAKFGFGDGPDFKLLAGMHFTGR